MSKIFKKIIFLKIFDSVVTGGGFMPYKNKEDAKQYAKRYYQKNKEKIAKNSRKPENLTKRLKYIKKYNEDNKEANALTQARWYQNNKQKAKKRIKSRYERHSDLLSDVKLYYGCMNLDCKWVESYVVDILDFHHCDPDQKNDSVSRMINCSKNIIAKEVNKCVVLCCNCHRLAHIGQIKLNAKCKVNNDLIPVTI